MKLGDRLDGHIVQGHVDQIGTCKHKQMEAGLTVTIERKDLLQ
jgi:riboflavin synthase